jgi:hypothetical protein
MPEAKVRQSRNKVPAIQPEEAGEGSGSEGDNRDGESNPTTTSEADAMAAAEDDLLEQENKIGA